MKLEVEFTKCNTTNNTTILIMSEFPQEQLPSIGSQLMKYGHLCAEQVGYVEVSKYPECAAKLQMAGGEFCGNACLALAANLAADRSLPSGEIIELSLEVSGSLHPISCSVKRLAGEYHCEASMIVPKTIEHAILPFEGIQLEVGIVRYHDSFHLVIDYEQFKIEILAAERLARLLGAISKESLIGIMLYRPSTYELMPLIYVSALDSLIWEQGCGSGTSSLGCYLAWTTQQSIVIPVQQPGGKIHTVVSWEKEGIKDISIRSTVDIVARGKAYVDIDV